MAERQPLNKPYLTSYPTEDGFFGDFGGSFIPPHLQEQMNNLYAAYSKIRETPEFIKELNDIRRNYQGRPTPLTRADRLTKHVGGTEENGVSIWLKREDLNHTGAHKLNHCVCTLKVGRGRGRGGEGEGERLIRGECRWRRSSSRSTSERPSLLLRPVLASTVSPSPPLPVTLAWSARSTWVPLILVRYTSQWASSGGLRGGRKEISGHWEQEADVMLER